MTKEDLKNELGDVSEHTLSVILEGLEGYMIDGKDLSQILLDVYELAYSNGHDEGYSKGLEDYTHIMSQLYER